MKLNRLLSLILFALLISFAVSARAQTDNVGFDVPGTEHILNSQLWRFAKGTRYSSIQSYLRISHLLSQKSESGEMSLPTGWKIRPAGTQVELGRLPYDAIMYNGRLVVLNSGDYYKEPQELSVVDIEDGKVIKTVKLNSIFPSACIGRDGYLYVSGGFDEKVYRIDRDFNVVQSFKVGGYVSGICTMDSHHLGVAYLTAENAAGQFGKGKIAILDLKTGTVVKESVVGYFPYAVAYADGKIFVSVLGENRVDVFNDNLTLQKSIKVGRGPWNLTVDGNDLYVVNQNSDNISVVDCVTERVVRTISLSEKGMKYGAAPTSCAVVGDRLYVSLATVNAAAVLNKASGKVLGFIPAGWYTTKVLGAEGKILIISAKGIHARRPNPNGPQPVKGKGGPDYVLNLLKGALSIVPERTISTHLNMWTKQVEDGSPLYSPAEGLKLPIKHIFYFIRENRTYDQVLGDLGRGNGDSTLTLFGRTITPNGHKIAMDFVDLDNYFADGEISVLGHSFTTSGYASPFLELLGNVDYSGRYKGYPYGTVPAVFSPTYIWDDLNSQKVPYKVYGEPYYLSTAAYRVVSQTFGVNSTLAKKFYDQSMRLAWSVDRGKEFSDFAGQYYDHSHSIKDISELLLTKSFGSEMSKIFVGDESLYREFKSDQNFRKSFAEFLFHYSFNYFTWDLKYSDLNRFKAWMEDFEYQLQHGGVPDFEYIWLPNDHTAGTNPDYPNPYQLVSENDAALGLFIQTISHSSIWKNSLILVEEDDAQNGPDHVDATRTVALAAGPYVKRNVVVHDSYDQLSMLRTIEVIFHLRPLNLEDALAVPMFGIFTSTPDFAPYDAAQPSTDLMPSDERLYHELTNNEATGK